MQALVPETPEAVCQIVAKLLAKTAEDRYQGAWGLWEDLERCLRDLREQGTIELFLPGERDVPARFELPQKLYGRGMELARLLAALGGGAWEAEPGEPAVMFLAGESGLGKTSLANEVKRHVLLRQGRFAAGKYDELSRGAPYSGLLEALRELVRRLLAEEGVEVAAFRRKIVNDLGTNLGILLEVLPELEAVTGEAASPVTVGPAEAKRRFHRSIGQLLKTFADTGDNAGPLVIFLDDLQWADPSSFELLTSTLTSELGPCLVLVAYRRDHIEAGHSLERLRGDLAGRGLRCESLELGPVGPNDVRQLVADALRMPAEESMPLADIVFERTAGNPFFVRTFLTALYDEGWLRFRPGTGWEWDLERIAERDVEENVARLLEKKIDHLDAAARHVVARAATLGHRFDIETLAMVCELSETETEDHLLAACRQGILLKLGFTAQTEEYQFLHDRLRESAYSTIPAADRPATHLAIGRILAERQVASGDEARDFKAVHQLNRAHRLIDALAERESVARLNLAAGLRARAGAAFPAADEFFTAGLELLGDDIWTTSYELALKLHQASGESALFIGDLEGAARRIEAVRGNARDLLDAVPAYELEAALAHARLGEAEGLRATFEVLGHLGVELSPEIGAEEAKALLFAAFKSSEPLLALAPEELARMEDPVCLAAMRLLLRLAFVAAWTNQRLYVATVARGMELTRERGHAPESAVFYVMLGAMRAWLTNDFVSGPLLAERGLELFGLLDAERYRSLASSVYLLSVDVFRRHFSEMPEQFAAARRAGLESGDVLAAASNAYLQCLFAFHSGWELHELEALVRECLEEIERTGIARVAIPLRQLEQLTSALLGLCLVLSDRHPELDGASRARHLELFEHYHARAEPRAQVAPMNYRHRLDLAEAERLRFKGAFLEALPFYDRAIDGARRARFVHDEAIAAELAAETYKELGHRRVAAMYLDLAASAYERWGAEGKMKQIARRHPELLTEPPARFEPRDGSLLDRTSLERAAQALTQTLDLEELLTELVRILLENAGAQSGFLLRLAGERELVAEARGEIDGELEVEILGDIPLRDREDLARSVVRYVSRTRETLVLDEAIRDDRFAADPYVRRTRLRSVLSAPILRQGRAVAIVYLENRLISGAFTAERLAAVQLISSQAAAALENARLVVGLRPSDDTKIITVRDNGLGIDPRYHEKVFGLFEKLEPDDEGTGIGLAIVKRVIELHDGRVWVESDGLGRGSTFCFTLPESAASV